MFPSYVRLADEVEAAVRCGFLTIPMAPELSMRGICGICRIIGPTTEWLHHISTNSSFFPISPI